MLTLLIILIPADKWAHPIDGIQKRESLAQASTLPCVVLAGTLCRFKVRQHHFTGRRHIRDDRCSVNKEIRLVAQPDIGAEQGAVFNSGEAGGRLYHGKLKQYYTVLQTGKCTVHEQHTHRTRPLSDQYRRSPIDYASNSTQTEDHYMKSRERILKALNHEEPDYLPIDMGGA
jgi:hypothetical protein